MTNDITTVGGRKRLDPRREPYWHRISTGNFLGFRKLDDGTGTWIARHRDDAGKQNYRALGDFQRFDEAEKKAREWFAQCEGGSPEVVTVAEACRRYVKDRLTVKGEATAEDAEGRFRRFVYDAPIGKLELPSLRTVHLTDWRNGLVDVDEEDDDPDAERKAKDSANRNLATLKAALNMAYRMGLVSSTAQWDRVESFQMVGRRRERFLTVAERNKLIDAASPALTRLLLAVLETAARPGELASATVGDLDPAGLLSVDGKTGQRVIPLSPKALAHLKSCAGSRPMDARLLTRPDGNPWTRFDWRDEMKEARKTAGLPDDVVLYNLRHVAISEMLIGGVDLMSVARIAGTSVAMIQRHYGHLVKDEIVAKLAQIKML